MFELELKLDHYWCCSNSMELKITSLFEYSSRLSSAKKRVQTNFRVEIKYSNTGLSSSLSTQVLIFKILTPAKKKNFVLNKTGRAFELTNLIFELVIVTARSRSTRVRVKQLTELLVSISVRLQP